MFFFSLNSTPRKISRHIGIDVITKPKLTNNIAKHPKPS